MGWVAVEGNNGRVAAGQIGEDGGHFPHLGLGLGFGLGLGLVTEGKGDTVRVRAI